jgi:hypothetical protein
MMQYITPRSGLLLVIACVSSACTERAGLPDPGRDSGGPVDSGMSGLDAGGDAGSTGGDAGPDGGAVDAWVDGGPPTACDESTIELPFPDAAAGSDTTDPAACSGCPAFTEIVTTPAGTTAGMTGQVTGSPTMCQWYLVSAGCGGTSGVFVPTEFTAFTLNLPLFCGTNRVQLVCENASGRAVATRDIAGPGCDIARDLQITLAWTTANDMELHLIREGGRINDATNDCTWMTCTPFRDPLDWGVAGDTEDNPSKDVDDTGDYGPENIFLSRAGESLYHVMVEYWGFDSGPDDADVTITLEGATVWRGSQTLLHHQVWDVGTISFPAGTFTPTPTAEAVIDCVAGWSSFDGPMTPGGWTGCALEIPD